MADQSVESVIAPARYLKESSKKLTEKSDSGNRGKVIPHYLRASTGSCHGSCKHGINHSFEEKVRKPLQKKTTTPLLVKVPGEKKKEKAPNQKSPTNTKDPSCSLNPSPEIIPYSLKQKTSLDTKKVAGKEPTTDTKKIPSLPEKKTYLRKSESASSINKLLSTKKDGGPVKQTSSADYKMASAEKKTSFPSKKSSSPVKPRPVKPKWLSSSLDNSDIIRREGKNTTISKASTKNVLAPKAPIPRTERNNLTKSGSVKSLSYSKDASRIAKKVDKTKIRKKIQDFIQTESSNDAIGPISSLLSPPSLHLLAHEEDKQETGQGNGEANNIIIPEKKENEGRSDLSRRIFKKGVNTINDDKTSEGTSSEKIVLKHQELHEGKKDSKGLLGNAIIEQAATKLVESRKSKVKALVGAFETVISLQESRPFSRSVG